MIPEKYHAEFKRFVEEGEASQEFLDFVEASPECRKALDLAFRTDDLGKLLADALQPENTEVE